MAMLNYQRVYLENTYGSTTRNFWIWSRPGDSDEKIEKWEIRRDDEPKLVWFLVHDIWGKFCKIAVVISCSWFVRLWIRAHTPDAFSSVASFLRVNAERSLPGARSKSKSRSDSASSSDGRTGAAWCSNWNCLKLNTVCTDGIRNLSAIKMTKGLSSHSSSHHSSRYRCYRTFRFLYVLAHESSSL